MKLIILCIGGSIGVLSRYGLSLLILSSGFPWATFTINMTGSFLIGLLYPLAGGFPAEFKLFLFAGLLGGFTTFSGFSIETLELIQSGDTWKAISYVLLSTVTGILLAAAGYQIARMFIW